MLAWSNAYGKAGPQPKTRVKALQAMKDTERRKSKSGLCSKETSNAFFWGVSFRAYK